jgi:Xaa-Pro dipeptidase
MTEGYIPASELNIRIEKLQRELAGRELDGALIVENTDLYYFSGSVPNGFLYIPSDGKPLLLVRKDINRSRQESPLEQVIPLDSMRNLLAKLADFGYQPQRLGMELDVLPVKDYRRYQKMFGNNTLIEDISDIIKKLRSVKSDYEIDLTRKSAVIHQDVFAKVPGLIREGMTDFELSARIECELRLAGHLGATRFRGFNLELFLGQVLAGEAAAAPSCYDTPLAGKGLIPLFPQGPSNTVITPNQAISVDFMGNYTGYMVDQTRLYCIGKLPDQLEKALNVALEVQQMVEEEAKPGANTAQIYEKSLQIVARAGLAEHFMGYGQPVSFIGHGVGLEVNELPVIAKGIEIPLEVGHIFAVEPKFVYPGLGVAGTENTYLVTETGVEKLTTTPDGICEIQN